MRIRPSELKTILKRYSGQPCQAPTVPKNGLRLFSSQDLSPFQANTTLGIGDSSHTEPTHVSILLSYRLLHAINQSPLSCRRFLDNQWYVFKQLPVLLSTKDNQHSNTMLIDTPTALSWSDFLKHYLSGDHIISAPDIDQSIGHHITSVSFDYNGTIPRNARLPNFVMSQQHPGRHPSVMLSLTVPRANCMPVEFNQLFNGLKTALSDTLQEHPTPLMEM